MAALNTFKHDFFIEIAHFLLPRLLLTILPRNELKCTEMWNETRQFKRIQFYILLFVMSIVQSMATRHCPFNRLLRFNARNCIERSRLPRCYCELSQQMASKINDELENKLPFVT